MRYDVVCQYSYYVRRASEKSLSAHKTVRVLSRAYGIILCSMQIRNYCAVIVTRATDLSSRGKTQQRAAHVRADGEEKSRKPAAEGEHFRVDVKERERVRGAAAAPKSPIFLLRRALPFNYDNNLILFPGPSDRPTVTRQRRRLRGLEVCASTTYIIIL